MYFRGDTYSLSTTSHISSRTFSAEHSGLGPNEWISGLHAGQEIKEVCIMLCASDVTILVFIAIPSGVHLSRDCTKVYWRFWASMPVPDPIQLEDHTPGWRF